jgi:hypothetical protein
MDSGKGGREKREGRREKKLNCKWQMANLYFERLDDFKRFLKNHIKQK